MEAPVANMELKPGDKLGPYEIVSALGKGGMGEVWRARDPRLGREVAVKISSQQFSDRFEREAKVVASLNHPNVCTLHDVGPNYLVMELVEGPTLAERIKRGPVPMDEALGIAKQIVYALEAAHDKGIVHRDLKPANVKIRPDGSVKVLDFGLAKTGDHAGMTADSSTIMMSAISVPGTILGTASYMSPEQAAGQVVDKRADIWSFGVVLYEVLAGRRLFQGDSMAHLLADVLHGPIDLEKLPKETPRKVRELMRRCLDRDVRNRLRDIGEARVAIEGAGVQGNAEGMAQLSLPHRHGTEVRRGSSQGPCSRSHSSSRLRAGIARRGPRPGCHPGS
jgi:serine/threonine-protein kinase